MRAVVLLSILCLVPGCAQTKLAQPRLTCDCEVRKPLTLKHRSCSLCAEAEKQPPYILAFSIPDASKSKPNRWLALPRAHVDDKIERLADLTPETRLALWNEAMARGQFLWGEHWGLAMNATTARSQCHVHIHIGRLIDGVEAGEFQVVNGPGEIPDPGDMGMWIHPVAGKLHVHREIFAENVLL